MKCVPPAVLIARLNWPGSAEAPITSVPPRLVDPLAWRRPVLWPEQRRSALPARVPWAQMCLHSAQSVLLSQHVPHSLLESGEELSNYYAGVTTWPIVVAWRIQDSALAHVQHKASA